MQAGYRDAGIDIGSQTFGIFIQTIPTRFYILYTLAFVFLNGLLCRDFGPMLKAEAKAQQAEDSGAYHQAGEGVRPQALNAVLPIAITVAVVVWLLVLTGRSNANVETLPPVQDWQAWCNVVGNGNSYLALVYGALSGLLAILLLNRIQNRLPTKEVSDALLEGFKHVLPALIILWLAWTLSKLTGSENLQTGKYLASQISQLRLAPEWMPTVVFVLASGIAFSTGTSWGTMAILMPIVIPLVYNLLSQQLGMSPAADNSLITATIGSVLAGAIFGDHCSPISDTTILSSRSSHCDHIAHVNTQMPYALTIGAVSIAAGTLPAGFGVSPWIALPIGLAALIGVLYLVGRPVPRASVDPNV
jgi:Na+/H+ antiporter NhaC